MDIEKTINCLTNGQFKSFERKASLSNEDEKLQKLARLIRKSQGRDSTHFCEKLFKKKNSDAYYKLRQRLTQCLIEFIEDHMKSGNEPGETQINSKIAIARFLFECHAKAAGNEMLVQAEKLAITGLYYHTLDVIYSLQLEHFDFTGFDLEKHIAKREANFEKYLMMRKMTEVTASIKTQLIMKMKEGDAFDPELTIRGVLAHFSIEQEYKVNPVFMHRLAEVCRSIIASSKDYNLFKPYFDRAYNRLVNANAFAGVHAHLELEFFSMGAHTCYRIGAPDESTKWLDKMKLFMTDEKYMLLPVYSKYKSLRASVAFISGDAIKAIQIIDESLANNDIVIPERERYNMEINRAVYHFYQGNFSQSLKYLKKLPKRTPRLVTLMSLEWFFKRDFVGAIVAHALVNLSEARSKMHGLTRTYKMLLDKPSNRRARSFIELVNKYFDSPEIVTTAEFAKELADARLRYTGQTEDIQAIFFFCWLKSKMFQRDAYEVLLERIAEMKGE